MTDLVTVDGTAATGAEADGITAERVGRLTSGIACLVFLAVAAAVAWRGAPLGDDFANCLLPQELGLAGFLSVSWDRLGVIRLARFVEIFVTAGVCRSLPFGVAILVPAAMTLVVALLARGLLRDLGTPAPWPDVAAATWLLQPLGTEAGLWTAALHVPLGLALALVALRLHRRERHGLAVAAALGAAVSAEQTILALPLAAWLVTPPHARGRALRRSVFGALGVVILFALWPGVDPRLQGGVGARLAALVGDPMFYVAFPAVGLGIHSIPLAFVWALPWSVLALAAGAAGGAWASARLPRGTGRTRRETVACAALMIALIALANAPVLSNVVRQGSPRLFAPTWLILAIAGALIGAGARWRHPRLAGGAAGACAAGAVLSLSLSASVRLTTADFNEAAARIVATRVPDHAEVAICGVRRTVTDPAPRGAFAVHEFLYDWSARHTVLYYTGRRARFHISGELWPERACPDSGEVDAVIAFDELLAVSAP